MPKLSEAAEIYRRKFGDNHPHAAVISHNIARAVHGTGDLEKAEKMYLAALAAKRRAFGPKHPSVSATLYLLARLYLERGEPRRSERHLREALPICREEMPGRIRTPMVQAALGAALTAQGRYDEAEKHLLAAYPLVVERAEKGSERIEDTLWWLVELYEARGEPLEAARYRQLLARQREP